MWSGQAVVYMWLGDVWVQYDRGTYVLIIVWNVLIIYFALSKLYSSFVL